jgi:hypothetical protein
VSFCYNVVYMSSTPTGQGKPLHPQTPQLLIMIVRSSSMRSTSMRRKNACSLEGNWKAVWHRLQVRWLYYTGYKFAGRQLEGSMTLATSSLAVWHRLQVRWQYDSGYMFIGCITLATSSLAGSMTQATCSLAVLHWLQVRWQHDSGYEIKIVAIFIIGSG